MISQTTESTQSLTVGENWNAYDSFILCDQWALLTLGPLEVSKSLDLKRHCWWQYLMPWQFSGGQGKEMVGMRGWSGGGGGMGGQPPSWHFPPAGGTGLRDTATTTTRAELGPTPAHCSEYQQNCRYHFSVFMIEFTDCVGVCVYFVFLISAINKHYPAAGDIL